MTSPDLTDRVAARIAPLLPAHSSILIGLSGGVDSVVLLHLLHELAPRFSWRLSALHVHHGISQNADAWAKFCAGLCALHQITLHIEHVDIAPLRAHGIEAAARKLRHAVFAAQTCDFVALAHHADDQAETLLLQLLRGAGPLGMAGMPELRPLAGSRAGIFRPLLGFARADIEAWARGRGLEWIDDESNDDTARQRNFVRHRVLPLIEERFPAARATAARAAAHLAEAGALLGELARLDLAMLDREKDVAVAALRQLGPMRAKNALRSLLQSRAIPAPTAAQLDELYRQLVDAREDRTVLLKIQDWELRRYRGRIRIARVHAPLPRNFREVWTGENRLPLLKLGGVLKFKPEDGRGLSVEQLRRAEVTVRLREGGERLRPDARRPRRALKKLMQERGIPPWQRARWPVLYCGEHLVCVPGIGEDCAWQAGPGEPGLILSWEPLE